MPLFYTFQEFWEGVSAKNVIPKDLGQSRASNE